MSYEECPVHECDATNGCPKCVCPDCYAVLENHDCVACLERQRDEARNIVFRLIIDRGAHFDGLWVPARRWLLGAESRLQPPEVRDAIIARFK